LLVAIGIFGTVYSMTVLKAFNLQESKMHQMAGSVPKQNSIETNRNYEIEQAPNGATVTGSPKMPEVHARSIEEKETDPVTVATELASRINSIKNLPDESGEKLSAFSQCAKELESINTSFLPKLAGRLMATLPSFPEGDALRSSFMTMANLAQLFLQDPVKKTAALEIFSTLPAMLPNLPSEDRTKIFVSLKNLMSQQLNKLKEEKYSTFLAGNINIMLASLSGAVHILPASESKQLRKELSHCINEYAKIPEDNSEDRFAPLLRKAQIENAARSYSVLLT
jgi:hypothetical protein